MFKKVKDSWNREEVITLVTKALHSKGSAWYQDEIDEWIEKHL